ncbi:hypothetical protein Y032_0332g2788 [Ancylostoma ceylanicum]|nr:hypothetical protein Y032_0332g2788 [Ancylostoma ceylanicum]
MLYEFKLSHSAAEAARNIALIFATDSPSEGTVRCWFAKISPGDFDLEDKPGRGRRMSLDDQALRAAVETKPDTTIRAANSLSGTAESTASASTPSYVCNEARTKATEYRRKGDLELSIKFVMPAHMGPPVLARGILARVLLQSGCHQFELKRVDPTPRAEYEEQASEYWYFITLTPEGDEEHDEMIVHFVEKFCYFVGGGFHDQILAEFPEIKVIFGEVRPQHNNVTLTSMAIGNMPNPGIFFVRGDYVTNYNEISNSFFTNCFARFGESTFTKQTDLASQLKVAGGQSFLSFAHFEHDRRYLTLFFAVRLCEREEKMDGLRFAAYKISLPYAAIVQITVDVGDSHNNTLYLRLKYPPQVWQAVPRTQQCRSRNRRVVNMEQCKEWVRVLKWPGDERSTGCSSEALAECLFLRVTLPKKNEDGNDLPTYHLFSIISRLMQRSNSKIFFGSVFTTRRDLAPDVQIRAVGSFRADYATKALLSRGATVSDQLLSDESNQNKPDQVDNHLFFDRVRWCMKECSRACEEALENLLCAIDERRVMDLVRAFHKMYTV